MQVALAQDKFLNTAARKRHAELYYNIIILTINIRL